MSRVVRFFDCAVFLLAISLGGSASLAQGPRVSPSQACLQFKGDLSLGARLARTEATLRTAQKLTIVALGSSSTSGFGTLGSGNAFPDVMKQELKRLRTNAQIDLINSGRIMDDIPANISRIDNDVLRYKPNLVIWQTGTNDVVWRGINNNAEELLGNAVGRLKDTHADVVLMDLQYAPLVLFTGGHTRMEQIIANVARTKHVGYFPRFLLMKRAIDAGVNGLVSWDGLHNSAEGYRCIGLALAQMIDAAAR